jgi:hypothetical protein
MRVEGRERQAEGGKQKPEREKPLNLDVQKLILNLVCGKRIQKDGHSPGDLVDIPA